MNDFNLGKPRVLMLGPTPPLTGGMSAILSIIGGSRLAEQCRLTIVNNCKSSGHDRRHGFGFFRRIMLLCQILKRAISERAQIAHIHTCSGFTFWRDAAFAIILRLLRIKIVWHIHGGMFDEFIKNSFPFARYLLKKILGLAEAVIVLSPDWITRLDLPSISAKYSVIPNGVHIPELVNKPETKRLNFIFLGNLGENKGVVDLIEATAIAVEKGFVGKVLIAGGETVPGQRDRLKNLITTHSLEDFVSLVGVVSGGQKEKMLLEASCFVLPSYVEAFPVSVLEAMAYGIPVIVTKVGALPDLIENGKEGFLIQPGDIRILSEKMLQMEKDKSLRKSMSAASRFSAKTKYSSDIMVGKIMDIYKSILSV